MKNRLLRLGLIGLLAALLAFVLQDAIRAGLVLPLLYAAWLGHLLVASIPQSAIWAIFFIAALFMAGRSLSRRGSAELPARGGRPAEPGRIERWARLIERSTRENYARWQLARELRKLTIEMLLPGEDYNLQQTRQDLAGNKLDLPPDIRAYLQASLTSFGYFSRPRWRFFWTEPYPSPLDLDPERMVQFLEDRYER